MRLRVSKQQIEQALDELTKIDTGTDQSIVELQKLIRRNAKCQTH